MRKASKMIGLSIGGAILLVLIIGILFVNFSPEFGGKPSQEEKTRFAKSSQYNDGKFHNSSETTLSLSSRAMMETLIDFIKGVPNDRPKSDLPTQRVNPAQWTSNDTTNRLIWFGHSAFLLKIDGKNILIDPMLGDVPAPHPWLGSKRYSSKLPIEIEELPRIDAVLISHDHYDHLDYKSILKLKNRVNQFLVPLGVGSHLKAWGIESSRILEFDWWQEVTYEHILFILTPARHFSGRGLTNRFSTLWGSWVIKGKENNLFFSGDSGYDKHFKKIGSKYGPFDFSMIECGQYNEKWGDIHMMPEETVLAAIDIKSRITMPIHWGAFTLALHTWTDPVERFSKEANRLQQSYVIPQIGEELVLKNIQAENHHWWD